MTTNFGLDLSCVDDLLPTLGTVSGRRLLSEAVVRRITTPRGRLIDDPNFGIDIRLWLDDDVTPADIQRRIRAVDAEIERDERVVNSTTQVVSFVNGDLVLRIVLEPSDEPSFSLTLSVTALTVEILSIT